MTKHTFLTIASAYSVVIGLVLILVPDSIFQSYGFPKIEDIPQDMLIGTAKDFIFYTGANALGLGVIYFMSRHVAHHKAVLLGGALVLILCAIMVIYRNANANTPILAWVDMGIRLAVGLGFLYYYLRDGKS
jgi:hypothetical protein